MLWIVVMIGQIILFENFFFVDFLIFNFYQLIRSLEGTFRNHLQPVLFLLLQILFLFGRFIIARLFMLWIFYKVILFLSQLLAFYDWVNFWRYLLNNIEHWGPYLLSFLAILSCNRWRYELNIGKKCRWRKLLFFSWVWLGPLLIFNYRVNINLGFYIMGLLSFV